MRELIIRVIGDAQNLRGFYSGVSRQTDEFVRNSTATYSKYFQELLDLQTYNTYDRRGTPIKNMLGGLQKHGSVITQLKQEYDQLQNSIRVTAETGLKLANGDIIPIAKTREWLGDNQLITAEMVKQSNLLGQIETTQLNAASQRRALRQGYRADRESIRGTYDSIIGSFRQQLFDTGVERSTLTDAIRDRRAWRAGGMVPGFQQARFDAQTNALIADRNVLLARESSLRAAIARETGYQQAAEQSRLRQYQNDLLDVRRTASTTAGPSQAELNRSRALEAQLRTQAPPVPPGYTTIQKTSPQLLRQLQKAGLTSGVGPLGDILQNQRLAEFNAPVRDLVRGVTHLGGSFIDNQGIMNKWSAELDSSGKLVTRFGGNLRGISRIADQIGRDFQKVIEWTVATTVVFGSLRVAMAGLDIIKTLDADLTRFQVTSGLSAEGVKKFYGELMNVAQVTATPIEELVKAADDLALAVRRPGQTIKELTTDVATLAEAIGIYTNLTGQDTVSATDQLVAVMKQLGVSATGVYDILNKVTAAAGGQSTAIADITKGLAVMAEAGQQAGLEVDQQIGVIKTLSQVTSKSPAEVATAFKNLVGALENPAALKALQKYNIALISQGNNIVSIYEEIAQKIRIGQIAPTDVSGLLRAISGGPRRAPDAAALLANINQVLKETEVSQEATNEAFLANAQIMTTLQAKYTQFQNTLKDKTFTQFGEVFKETATTLIQFGTTALDLFSKIPPSTISMVIQMGAFLLAIKLGQKLISSFGLTALTSFKGIRGGATSAKLEFINLAAAIRQVNYELQTAGKLAAARGALSFGGRYLRAGVGGALVGGAIGAMSGMGPQQIGGSALQGLGVTLLAMPEPSLISKVAGGVALLAGTYLMLQENQDKASESTAQLSQELLQAYQLAKQGADTFNAVMTDREIITQGIKGLEAKTERTPEDQAQLNDLYNQYGKSIVAAGEAQKQLNEAVERFGEIQQQLPSGENMAARLRASLLGDKTDEDIVKILKEATINVISETIPEVQGALDEIKKFNIAKDILEFGGARPSDWKPQTYLTAPGGEPVLPPNMAVTKVMTDRRGAALPPVDLENLDTEQLKRLFTMGKDGAYEFTAQLNLTQYAIDKINEAIADSGDLSKPFQTAFNTFAEGKDILNDVAIAMAYFTNVATAQRGIGLQKTASQTEGLVKALDSIITVAPTASKELQEILDIGTELGNNPTQILDENRMYRVGEIVAQATGSIDGFTEGGSQANAIILAMVESLFGVKLLINESTGAMVVLGEAASETLTEIGKIINEEINEIAKESSNAFGQLLQGEISPDKYAEMAAQINTSITSLRDLNEAFYQAASEGGDAFQIMFDQVKNELSTFPGLENAATMSAQEFMQTLFGLGDAMNLSGRQAVKFRDKSVDLAMALIELSRIRVQFGIAANVDLRAAIKDLIALRDAAKAIGASQAEIAGFNNAIAQLQSAQRDYTVAKAAAYHAGRTTGAGSTNTSTAIGGGGGGGGSRTRQGKDYSELDLPEELSGLPTRDALIRQAIRNARRLQRRIPGASKEARNDVVTILDGMKKLETVRGVREDLLRRALEDLAAIEKKRLEFETKADTIRRIRVGGGDFAAIANVPVNTKTGISLGGDNNINVTLNLNGTVLTPAQFAQFADMIAAALKRQLAK